MTGLIIVYPTIERGRNGRKSWNRTRARASIIPFGENAYTLFSENKENKCYITIEQALYIADVFGTCKPLTGGEKIVIDRHGKEHKIEDGGFHCTRFTENGGISAEFNLSLHFGWTLTGKADDINGIDIVASGIPFQVKTFGFGIKELENYLANGTKKSGISICNGGLAELQTFLDGKR